MTSSSTRRPLALASYRLARAVSTALTLALTLALSLTACKGDVPGALTTSSATSALRIEQQVLGSSCTFSSCHIAGGSGAIASGLFLNGAGALSAMINKTPSNAAAVAAGFKLVRPGKADSSLLYLKLLFDTTMNHSGLYGGAMPLGGPSLSLGQIEYVRRWIAAGATVAGDALDTMLLRDRTIPVTGPPYVALAPPAQGTQLAIAPFSVNPAFEREFFSYRTIGNAAPMYVSRIETNMRPGSHHFVLYSFNSATPVGVIPAPNTIRDLRNADGSLNFTTAIAMAFHVFLAGAQAQRSDYTFPPGVALKLPAGAAVDLNSHYVNPSPAQVTGEVQINLHTVDSATVVHEAYTLNMNNLSILVPQGRDTTIVKTFPVAQTTSIFMLTSHMHAGGLRFVIRIAGGARDGELVYDNNDWAHPLTKSFDVPIVLLAGQGLTSEVTYHGDPNRAVTFGLTSTDQMGIIFGYAW